MGSLIYHKTAERPVIELWLIDDDGALIDFSSGYTFSWKIGHPGNAAVLTKTSGITGAAGSGSEPDGTPNVTIQPAAGEFNITAGVYSWQLTATTGSTDRVYDGLIKIKDVIT
jgi:hypothetical protein